MERLEADREVVDLGRAEFAGAGSRLSLESIAGRYRGACVLGAAILAIAPAAVRADVLRQVVNGPAAGEDAVNISRVEPSFNGAEAVEIKNPVDWNHIRRHGCDKVRLRVNEIRMVVSSDDPEFNPMQHDFKADLYSVDNLLFRWRGRDNLRSLGQPLSAMPYGCDIAGAPAYLVTFAAKLKIDLWQGQSAYLLLQDDDPMYSTYLLGAAAGEASGPCHGLPYFDLTYMEGDGYPWNLTSELIGSDAAVDVGGEINVLGRGGREERRGAMIPVLPGVLVLPGVKIRRRNVQ